MGKPNLFIIGAPKCGTTSLAYYLNQHPQIFVSPYKEPHYFNFDSNHRFTFSEKQYLKNFKNASNSSEYLVDASVWYLYSGVAVNEILKFNPKAKFIVMLRNPIEMFYSLHQQCLFNGTENINSPLKAWLIQEKRKKGLFIPYACNEKSLLFYKDACSLGAQVNCLLTKVSKESVHFILLDDLKSNAAEVYKNVLNFLNIKLFTLPKFNVLNERKEQKFGQVSTILGFFNKIKRKLNIRKGLGLANFIVSKNIKKPSEKFKEEYASMKPMLIEAFKEDVALLSNTINIDTRNWLL